MNAEKNPSVSIVTVVLNDRAGLSHTENSILSQTSSDYEWIVVDGGSRDGSVGLLESSAVKRLEWSSEPDRGIYDAMNKGIRRAAGEYVLFLNAGDELSSEHVVEEVARLIQRARGNGRPAPVVMGGANLVLSEDKVVRKAPRGAGYMWHSLPASHQAMFFPSDFLAENPYDTSYRVCGDYYIGALAYKLGREFVTVGFPIVDFRVGGFSYQHPLELMKEAARIQRTVLKIGYPRICASTLYRAVNTLGLRALKKMPLRPPAGWSPVGAAESR